MKKMRSHHWRYMRVSGDIFYSIGIEADGSLWNPNGYPEDRVRELVTGALERARQRHEKAIKRGVEKRKRRRETRIHEAARKLLIEAGIGDRDRCYCCNKLLSDPVSMKRGIGPECWEIVLRRREQLRPQEQRLTAEAAS
jgi:Family of unknown function (DUF6011)